MVMVEILGIILSMSRKVPGQNFLSFLTVTALDTNSHLQVPPDMKKDQNVITNFYSLIDHLSGSSDMPGTHHHHHHHRLVLYNKITDVSACHSVICSTLTTIILITGH